MSSPTVCIVVTQLIYNIVFNLSTTAVGATGVEPMRLEILLIRIMRLPGIEAAEETATVRYRASAVKSAAIVRSEIGFPLRGSCHRR